MGQRVWAIPTSGWELALILGAALFAPAMIVVNNTESPGLGTAGLITAIVALVALATRAFLALVGASPVGATYAVATGIFVLSNTGFVAESVVLGRWLAFVFAGLSSLAIYRLHDTKVVELAVTAGTFILILTPIVTWVGSWDAAVIDEPVSDIGPVVFGAKPDVVVIVADGYANDEVLEEFYSYDNRRFTDRLNSIGLHVGEAMTANYGRTALSIPSFLESRYVLEGRTVGRAARGLMLDVLSGESHLGAVMRRNGYETVYVESGWLGTSCGPSVDHCVRGPWPDETFYDVVHRSALRGIRGFETGITFARGSIRTLRWLDDDLVKYLENGRPEYIFVHILAPHPPMFLDAGCRLDADAAVGGFAVGMPDLDVDEIAARRAAYVDQVQCVNNHLELAAQRVAESNAIVLIFGDHGPDQGSQMYFGGDEWTADQRRERFGVLFAVFHESCDYGDLVSLVNVSRRMLSCLSDTEIPSLPDRYFDLSRSEGQPMVVELADAGS